MMQARAIRTREKIMRALEALLARREFETIAIADIAREAGVAVGSVYSHFKDKAALLPALLERRLDRAEDWTHQLELNPPSGATLEATVHALVTHVQAETLKERGPIRATFTYRRLHPGTDMPRRGDINARLAAMVENALSPHRDEIGHDELALAARRVHYIVHAAFLDDIMVMGPLLPEGLTPSADEKRDMLVTMVCGYLRGG